MSPEAATYCFLWEINADEVLGGKSVRTFGRLSSYDAAQSLATLTIQQSSEEHQLQVSTRNLGSFTAQRDSLYLALGELEMDGSRSLLHARQMSCINGANIALLQQAVETQRRYFEERHEAATDF